MLSVQLPKYHWLFFVLVVLVTFSCKTKTQTVQNSQGNKPDTLENSLIWITMIDSPGVNYYQAVEAFNKYWEHREKPTEADGEGKDLFGKETGEQGKGSNGTIPYVYEYKRFLNWQQRNKNLVKPDGTLMTPEEVLEQWKKLQTDSLTNNR